MEVGEQVEVSVGGLLAWTSLRTGKLEFFRALEGSLPEVQFIPQTFLCLRYRTSYKVKDWGG